MLSRSGETASPSTSRSSPTFPITVTSRGSTAATRPRAKRAAADAAGEQDDLHRADELAERDLRARAGAEAEALEIVERVDVVAEIRDRRRDRRDALRLGVVAEARRAAAAVERGEERRPRERERVRRPVRPLPRARAASELGRAGERAQVVRDDARNVRVDDEHGAVVRSLERGRHRRALTAAGIVDDLGAELLGERASGRVVR